MNSCNWFYGCGETATYGANGLPPRLCAEHAQAEGRDDYVTAIQTAATPAPYAPEIAQEETR